MQTKLNVTEDLYSELFKRNQPIISASIQQKLKNLKVLVAGCGSTGGAFIEGASRLGVMKFVLVEPDTYDLNNLNRQFVYPSDLGINKATVHEKRLNDLFYGCGGASVQVNTDGVQAENIEQILTGVDLVFDAVDVTTTQGMQAKLLLHEYAAKKNILVLSALDLAFKQWIRVFDYRTYSDALEGRLAAAKNCKNPLKALIEGVCPIDELSYEIAEEVIRLLQQPQASACQLGAACHLLAAFTAPMLIRICENKTLPKVISFDVMRSLETPAEQALIESRRQRACDNLKTMFSAIP